MKMIAMKIKCDLVQIVDNISFISIKLLNSIMNNQQYYKLRQQNKFNLNKYKTTSTTTYPPKVDIVNKV